MKARIFFAVLFIGGMLAARPCPAQVGISVEAVRGVPFGVGRVTIQSGGEMRVNRLPLARPGAPRGGRIVDLAKRFLDQQGKGQAATLESAEMTLVEKSGRVFYPVFEKQSRPILREFVSVPTQAAIFFLFVGDAPLELTAYAPEPTVGSVTPVVGNPGDHERLLNAWWRDFSAAADEDRNAAKEYPPIVEEYLTNNLARRLNLPLPQRQARKSSLLRAEMDLLLETETGRLDMARAILLDQVPLPPASEPLPQELPRPKPELLNPPAQIEIEPLAMRVPVECMYVRFGTFTNFLWLRHRLVEWGGEMRDLLSERGLNFALNERMQRQLGLRENALAELLGEKVIADVALIGTDPFLRDGAAMGTLFQARNSGALKADLTQQRLLALKEGKNGHQEVVQIGDHEVSFFSTPDNSLRSFYVADGDFHLVTTSRALVERFLATGAGNQQSLGASDEFRLARSKLPLNRNDTVFIYLSPDFFQNLMGAHYQVEADRRLRSAVEIELVQIAQLAARAEGKPGESIQELIAAGFLPPGFGKHADGSSLEIVNGEIIDSLRGGRGKFVPVPDMKVDKITRGEAVEYQRLAAAYVNELGPMGPIVGSIQRKPLEKDGLERVVIDLQAAPLSQQHMDLLNRWLGPASDQRLAPVPADAVAFEVVARGGNLLADSDHHLFGALRDADPSIALDTRASLISRLFASQLQGLNGYLGAWPNAGYLKLLGSFTNIPPDASGYSRLLSGLSRRQFNGFTLLSFHPEVLAAASPHLQFVKAERPAQLWFRADDLAQSKLAPMLNAYGYRQSRQVALGNTRFMNMLIEQLHVPPADARAIGEQLLDARFVCPFGGDYVYEQRSDGLKTWVSTAIAKWPNPSQPPPEYQFPPLRWFRGMELEMSADNGQLAIHADAIMSAETKAPAGFQFPGFSLPGAKLNPSGTAPKVAPGPTRKNEPRKPGAREF